MKRISRFHFNLMLISGFLLFFGTTGVQAQGKFVDNEILAGRIANSVHQKIDRRYNTLAISRIRLKDKTVRINVNELIDYSNVKIVRGRRFRVTDRSKLQLLLKEQRIQLSEFVSPNEYRELGMLLGVQLFIYGNVYSDTLVLKAIDVQNSQIVWAETFTLFDQNKNYELLNDFSGKLIESFGQDEQALKEEDIKKVSFWSIDSPRIFENGEVMDYMTVALSTQGAVNVVDRENLQLIYNEQKLNQEIYIDENKARRLGELYGVDAFLYGNISRRVDGEFVASMKMMNVFSGVITWADLLKFRENDEGSVTIANPFSRKIQERLERNKGNGMIAIPGGMFLMGTDDPLYANSKRRLMRVRPFQIDQTEVSNGDYLAFVEANNHRRPVSWTQGMMLPENSDLPVVGISWEDARMYCRFLGKRLPTEAEWEWAARGGKKNKKYPWGDISINASPMRANFWQGIFPVKNFLEDGYYFTSPTGSFNSNGYGLNDMAGNVWEWCSDYYDPNIYKKRKSDSLCINPLGPSTKPNYNNNHRVLRGGSFLCNDSYCSGYRVSRRTGNSENTSSNHIGFRCVLDIDK